MTKEMLTGNASAAWGVRLAEVDYIPAYPITPQTEIIEALARWIADEPDHNDILAARDCGFLQIHCETCPWGAVRALM